MIVRITVHVMLFLYHLGFYLVLPFIMLRTAYKAICMSDGLNRWRQRFGIGFMDRSEETRPLIWVHLVSVGEVMAGRLLVKNLLQEFPEYDLLITTRTPSGVKVSRREFGDAVLYQHLPYDIPHAIARFLRRLRPQYAILTESEFWPQLCMQCQRHNVPVILVSATVYRLWGLLFRFLHPLFVSVLHVPVVIMAQSEAAAEKLIELGAPAERVQVTGNLKYAAVDVKYDTDCLQQRRNFFAERTVWVAGSTHNGEEELLFAIYQRLRQEYPDLLLVVAPRHMHRVVAVKRLCKKHSLSFTIHSHLHKYRRKLPINSNVFLLDGLGDLYDFYAYADIAFVGGSLVSTGGGHNVLEPLSQGVATVTGQHVCHFAGIVNELCEQSVLFQVASAEELYAELSRLLAAPKIRMDVVQRAQKFIQQKREKVLKQYEIVVDYIRS